MGKTSIIYSEAPVLGTSRVNLFLEGTLVVTGYMRVPAVSQAFGLPEDVLRPELELVDFFLRCLANQNMGRRQSVAVYHS